MVRRRESAVSNHEARGGDIRASPFETAALRPPQGEGRGTPSTKPGGLHTFSLVPPRLSPIVPEPAAALLPDRFEKWFATRGWAPRAHQLALLEKARDDRSALLIAPTGAGKTLAGFLPTLVELSASVQQSLQLPPPLRGRPTPEGRREGGK